MSGRVLVVMPLYNEEATLQEVLEAVLHYAPPGTDVLVVDDGSTDGSAEILARFPEVRVIRHPENRGYGASLIDGFRYALDHGYDAVVTMDCDAQHEPYLIPDLLSALEDADIVSGSRYLPGSSRGQEPPPDRLRINREVTERVNALTGYRLTDAFCGFKAYRADALRRMQLDEPSYGMPLQVWVQAARWGLRVREIPIGRIYKNPHRRFWGGLDDPEVRLRYYLQVLEREAARWLQQPASSGEAGAR
ncbi:MAG: glycosyltransferase family 2 protein [Armatimonadota bacterium]|nr:glycosyltransferase family 2 protein [Armatimonadota bacterium]MDR7389599.1 glycosyltransferase family 2 protein [Armatimonadota bacterium]MDR7394547.1 glycosyltransferase family 2 protein [Armatimonadota bacterium]MDR7396921.1 glycosyltransferase family 2 protein [Armatimonadota bacterium]MDR7398660.1 glycosyltransferase family 2 protein [Armatimonadota bacterium]